MTLARRRSRLRSHRRRVGRPSSVPNFVPDSAERPATTGARSTETPPNGALAQARRWRASSLGGTGARCGWAALAAEPSLTWLTRPAQPRTNNRPVLAIRATKSSRPRTAASRDKEPPARSGRLFASRLVVALGQVGCQHLAGEERLKGVNTFAVRPSGTRGPPGSVPSGPEPSFGTSHPVDSLPRLHLWPR